MSPVWNWKTALFSGLYRASGFVVVSAHHGGASASRAGLAEFLLFAAVNGFAGAVVQRVRHLRPLWIARLVVLGLLPAAMHLAEFGLHTALGTPARRSGLVVSICMSLLSETFNWHAMRQGAMLAGGEGASLATDLGRVPALTVSYLRWIAGRT
jgi:hypothetical protein